MIGRRPLFQAGLLTGALGLFGQPIRADQVEADTHPENAASVWTSFYAGTRVWGYVNRHSVVPGESFNVMLSTGPNVPKVIGSVEIFRIGPTTDGTDRTLVFRTDPIDVGHEVVQMTACSAGACWPTAFEDVPTGGWRSGYHTMDFIDQADGQRDLNVAYIVVTSPDPTDILVGLSTNTYQAYNAWGGASLYVSAFTGDRAQMISFDRPTPPDFFEYEYFLIMWLERLAAEYGLSVGYASNFDIHRAPQMVEACRLLILGAHDEYWSKEEFDNVYHRIFVAGKSTLFIGANTAYWQIRYVDINQASGQVPQGRQMVCYKSEDDPIRQSVSEPERLMLTTMMFRDEARRPETMLAGVAYQSYFEWTSNAKYAYTVQTTAPPFFAGTGYEVGDKTPDIVGYEWDNTDPDGDGKRLWDPEKSLIPPIEREAITVAFASAPIDLNGKTGRAEAVYFISPAGGKVFSTGSIRWVWGLGKPGFEQPQFSRFNRNLVLHLLDA
jgi:hypothetical protein